MFAYASVRDGQLTSGCIWEGHADAEELATDNKTKNDMIVSSTRSRCSVALRLASCRRVSSCKRAPVPQRRSRAPFTTPEMNSSRFPRTGQYLGILGSPHVGLGDLLMQDERRGKLATDEMKAFHPSPAAYGRNTV